MRTLPHSRRRWPNSVTRRERKPERMPRRPNALCSGSSNASHNWRPAAMARIVRQVGDAVKAGDLRIEEVAHEEIGRQADAAEIFQRLHRTGSAHNFASIAIDDTDILDVPRSNRN